MEVFFGQTDFAVRADDAGKPLSDDSGASTVTVACCHHHGPIQLGRKEVKLQRAEWTHRPHHTAT